MERLTQLTQHLGGRAALQEQRPSPLTPAGGSAAGHTPRIAVLVSFWGATSSHADWIVTKLIDGYWWDGAYKESGVEVAAIYMHQHDTSVLGHRVAQAKGIPVFETVDGGKCTSNLSLLVISGSFLSRIISFLQRSSWGERNSRSTAWSSSRSTVIIRVTSKATGSCRAGGSTSRL